MILGSQRRPSPAWLLASLGAAIVGLLALFVALHARAPLGFSPRIGSEPDVTGFFPAVWRLLPRLSVAAFRPLTTATLVALWAIYAVVLWLVGRQPSAPRSRFTVLAVVTVVAQVTLVLAPPVVCNDIFHYALFGRMVNGTPLNPYLTAGGALVGDPIMPYATWPTLPSHYGPTFTWLSAIAARLGGDGVLGTAIAFKGMVVAFNLAACWLLRAIARGLHGGDGAFVFAAYGWNPLVLFEGAVIGHNEPIMLALALGGLLLIQRCRAWPGFACLVLSVDVKQVTAALALFLAVRFVFEPAAWRQRLGRAAGLLGLAAGLVVVLWLPFWAGTKVFSTSRELMAAGAYPIVTAALFAAAVLVAARFAARADLVRVVDLAAGVIFLFVVVVFPFRFPWYSISPLALAAVNARTRPRYMALGVVVLWGALLMLQYTALHRIS